jgi:transcriptional regulator with XRE-family HTH domain
VTDQSTPVRFATGYLVAGYDDLVTGLTEKRIEKGLTMEEIARRTGWSAATVSRVLAGVRQAPGRKLFDLLHALGYDLALIPREDTCEPS